MEVQVSFPKLRSWLSYESVDDVSLGDHVEILDGKREGTIGTVTALQRGSHKGKLCSCRKTSAGTGDPTPQQQDLIVKSRLQEDDEAPREEAPRQSHVPPREDAEHVVIGVNLGFCRGFGIHHVLLADRLREMFGDHMLPGRGFYLPVQLRLAFDADSGDLGRHNLITQADTVTRELESVLRRAFPDLDNDGFLVMSIASGYSVLDAADDVYLQILNVGQLRLEDIPGLIDVGRGRARPPITIDPCTECQGTGYRDQNLCPDCRGVGSRHVMYEKQLASDPYSYDREPFCDGCYEFVDPRRHAAEHGLCAYCWGFRAIQEDPISECPPSPCYTCGAMGTQAAQASRAEALSVYTARAS